MAAMDEGLMQDDRGRVVAATQANLFVRMAGDWVTPVLDECGVAGVMRRAFRQWAAETRRCDCRAPDRRGRNSKARRVPGPDECADRRLARARTRGAKARRGSDCRRSSTHGSHALKPGVSMDRARRGRCGRRLARLAAIRAALAVRADRDAQRQPVTFDVPQGASLRTVAGALQKQGLMQRPPDLASWHATAEGLATKIQAGEYRLMPGTSPAMLLDQFVAGDVVPACGHAAGGLDFPPGTGSDPGPSTGFGRAQGHDRCCAAARDSACRTRIPEGFSSRTPTAFRAAPATANCCVQAHARLDRELQAAWEKRETRASRSRRPMRRSFSPHSSRRDRSRRRAAAHRGRLRRPPAQGHAPSNRPRP